MKQIDKNFKFIVLIIMLIGSKHVSSNTCYNKHKFNNTFVNLDSNQIKIISKKLPKIAAGFYHSIGIRYNGTLWSWGFNNSGQLGNGGTNEVYIPVQISKDSNWQCVAAGSFHSLALKNNGSLWAWGFNEYGQTGNGKPENILIPEQIGSDTNWMQITAGYYHSAAVKKDGSLWSWGDNSFGQLGDSTNTESKVPIRIGVDNDWIQVSAGYSYSIGLKQNGSIWFWGINKAGVLIFDSVAQNKSIPSQIGIDTDWIAISAGDWHMLAIKKDSTLWSWGYNTYGQLGNGTYVDVDSPMQISQNKWIKIAGGYHQSIALQSDSSLWCWGANEAGQLGDGSSIKRPTPTKVASNLKWDQIASGYYFTLAVNAARHQFCAVGSNNHGQLGAYTNLVMTNFTCSYFKSSLETNLTNHLQVTIYPNPSNGAIKIKSNVAGEYLLINEFGIDIERLNLSATNNFEANLIVKKPGIYFLVNKSPSNQIKKKVIIIE